MKEYGLGIHTNTWNALRYALITLGLVPFAEKLWSLMHSRRTGARVVSGRTARLRQSRLEHWGLHQEVDEKSRLSRLLAIVVIVLHIVGAILVEYGSGSTEKFIFQDSLLSPTLRVDGGLRANAVYFFDAGNIFGKADGLGECIDGGPRNLSDFGLLVREFSASRLVPSRQIPKPKGKVDLKARYFIPNSGISIEMYDNASARWFVFSKSVARNAILTAPIGFVNGTVSCQDMNFDFFQCSENEGKIEYRKFLSDMLARVAVLGAIPTNRLWRQDNRTTSLDLSKVSIRSPEGLRRPSEEDTQTAWVRRGMPREQFPRENRMFLLLNIKGLEDGCNHKHAVPVSSLRNLRGLNVSNPTFFPATLQRHALIGGHKLLFWLIGNKTRLGTVTEESNGYCSDIDQYRLCVKTVDGSKHEIAQYRRRSSNISFYYTKVYNFTVEGELRGTDALDIAVQSSAEMVRKDQIVDSNLAVEVQKRVAKFIASGRALSGLVRVTGKGIQGKSAVRKAEIATINILGIFGLAILLFLVVIPIAIMLQYRDVIVINVQSSYRRAVMRSDGAQSCMEAPERAPTICATQVDDGDLLSISHTFKL